MYPGFYRLFMKLTGICPWNIALSLSWTPLWFIEQWKSVFTHLYRTMAMGFPLHADTQTCASSSNYLALDQIKKPESEQLFYRINWPTFYLGISRQRSTLLRSNFLYLCNWMKYHRNSLLFFLLLLFIYFFLTCARWKNRRNTWSHPRRIEWKYIGKSKKE